MVQAQGSSSKSRTQPWAAQAPYLQQIYQEAQSLFNQGPYQYYPESTVAGFDPATQASFRMAEDRAAGGSPAVKAAQQNATATMRGDYLDPQSNPWLQQTYDLAAGDMRRSYYDAVNALGSRFGASGRTGGGAEQVAGSVAQENFARGLGQLGADIYGGNYQQERGRQMQMAGMATGLADYDYRDIDAMRNIGAQREQMAQSQLNDLIARFEQNQRGGAEKLAEFSNLLGAPVMAQKSSASSWGGGISLCWGAAELFGWFTPKFVAARRWICELWEGPEAEDFREFYVEHGRELGQKMAEDPSVREQWAPFFEWAAEQGA